MCLFPPKPVFVGGFFCRPLLWPKTNQAAKKKGDLWPSGRRGEGGKGEMPIRRKKGKVQTLSNVPFQWKDHILKCNVYYCRIYAIVSCIFSTCFFAFSSLGPIPPESFVGNGGRGGRKNKRLSCPHPIPARQRRDGFSPSCISHSKAVEKRGLSYVSESIYFCLQHSKHVCLVCHT